LRRSEDAPDLQQGAMGALRTLEALSAKHVPDRSGKRNDEHEADELPGPLSDLRQRSAQLSRIADSLPRADASASQRSFGRALRTDARAAVLAGRCALFPDAGSDRRRGRAPDPAYPEDLWRFRIIFLGQAVYAAW